MKVEKGIKMFGFELVKIQQGRSFGRNRRHTVVGTEEVFRDFIPQKIREEVGSIGV